MTLQLTDLVAGGGQVVLDGAVAACLAKRRAHCHAGGALLGGGPEPRQGVAQLLRTRTRGRVEAARS